jgi:hypothetical protein
VDGHSSRPSLLALELGAAVNGQPENVPSALPRLAEILANETDAQVVTETVAALGHAWDHQAGQLILDHVRLDHTNADVRSPLSGLCPTV